MFAAASTIDALDELNREFERQAGGGKVVTNYGSSAQLARQIIAGAEADVYLSANVKWADEVAKKRAVERRVDRLSNRLVVVVGKDSPLAIASAADLISGKLKFLALGDPQAVPAGIYARQALEKLGLWSRLQSKVVSAFDVREALLFVERGEAEAGIVYASDAVASKRVRVACEIDSSLSEPVRYPFVLLKPPGSNPLAARYFDFLRSDAAAAIFRKHGFIALDAHAAGTTAPP